MITAHQVATCLNITRPFDFCVWNNRELTVLHIASESEAQGRDHTLNIECMSNFVIIELLLQLAVCWIKNFFKPYISYLHNIFESAFSNDIARPSM